MTPTIRTTATIALLTLGIAGCDPSGPDVGPPAELQTGALPGTLVVGQTVAASLTVRDDEGRAVEGETVSWSASGAGSVSPASSATNGSGEASTQWTLDTAAGTQTLTASVGGLSATFTADADPDELNELILSPTDTTLESLGDTTEITAFGADQYGNQTPTPSLTWSSSDPTIASVVGGTVVSHADGTVDITATSGTITGNASVTVDQVAVALAIEPDAPVMVVGETLDATADVVDARGTPVDTTLSVSWSSSDTGVASVSSSGTVSAVGTGSATITATAGSFSDETVVEVRTGPRPSITGISPAVLGAGDTATISGSDFGTDPALVDVSVGGVAAPVLTVTDTEVTAQMPEPGTFPCGPSGDREVVVAVDGLDATATHPVAGAARHTLAVGGSVAFFGNDVACNELTEPGTYIMSVFNTSTSADITTAFQLRGSASGTALAADGLARPRTRVSTERATLEPDPTVRGHLEMLERNMRLVEELGMPDATRADGPEIAREQVGDLRTFRIPDLDEENVCTGYIEVDARASYVGTYGVIWEDTVAPLAGQIDSVWTDVGTEYDDVMHQILLDYFGDPLVFDDRLDDNGLFFMLFSEAVNNYDSTAVNGFVFSGDFFSRADCASSDSAEIFYGRVPTVANTNNNAYEAGETGDWAWRMRSTVIHEVKHLTAFANKFDANASAFEESGLEEATARLAEEFFGRALQGYGQGDNVGYDESIFCERRVGSNWPSCDHVPVIMAKHYSGINAYFKTPATLSPFGRVDADDFTFYGSGWQWVRWAIDQSGMTEANVIKPLIREPSLRGAANLADKVGRTVPELLADYTLAFAVDDHPSGTTPVRSELAMPSWDTRDIFQGLHDDYTDTGLEEVYPTPWPLATEAVSGGGFQVDVPEIRGGAATIFELSGMTGAQLLELLSASGGTAPGSLGLSIVRIQ